jgi:hypothetical protein
VIFFNGHAWVIVALSVGDPVSNVRPPFKCAREANFVADAGKKQSICKLFWRLPFSGMWFKKHVEINSQTERGSSGFLSV